MKSHLFNILAVLLSTANYLFGLSSANLSRVIFLDVGQGDAALIQYHGLNIVIDAGPNDAVVYRIGKYLSPMFDSIDILILSHPHEDHISGVIELHDRYEIKQIWLYPVCYKSTLYEEIFKLGIEIHNIQTQDSINYMDLSLSVIYPNELSKASLEKSYCNEKESGIFRSGDGNINNDSIVVVANIQGMRILFTGDIEEDVEKKLISNKLLGKFDVLKAPHHCSDTSNSVAFVELTKPSTVICSVGEDNSFNHPSPDVVNRYIEAGSIVHITYISKDVIIQL